MTRLKGKLKKVAGWVTGDRRVEAEGKVEAERGHEPDAGELARAKRATRRKHGDITR